MRHTARYVTLLYTVLLPGILTAQHDSVQFNHLTIEDGLSQSTVQSVIQDSEGYMWFGTQDGLNKYNGYDINVYKSESENPESLSDNDIRILYEDRQNRLWIGTQTGGLNLYNRKKDRFTRYIGADDPDQWFTLSSNTIWAILEDSRGDFWVGTTYGLNLMDRQEGTFLRIFSEPDNPETLSHNQINVIYEDKNGTLWVGTANGLNRLNRDDFTFNRYLHGSGDRISRGSYYIRDIYEDSEGILWVGTEEKGLIRFDRENETFQTYTYDPNDTGSLSDNAVFSIIESDDDHLWIGTGNGGLNLLNRSDNNFTRFRHQSDNPQSLSNDGINTLYKSRDETLWIGTFAGGVDYMEQNPPMFSHYRNEPVNPNSLSNNTVQSFYQDKKEDDIWIGTDGGGLNRFDSQTGRFEHFRHQPNQENSLSSDVVLDIFGTEEGLWLGTYGGGLNLFDPEKEQFTHYRHNPDDRESLSSDFVFAITQRSNGDLWFGTNLGGISILNTETDSNRFQRLTADTEQPESPETIGNNDIRSIFEDSTEDMWIGAYGGALNRYDNDEQKYYLYDVNQNSDLYASVVQDIYEDRQKRLWLATRGGGLKLYLRESDRLFTYSKKDGLPSNIIHAIEEDEFGYLWLSTNNGISRFHPDTENFRNYHLEHGLQSREFNPSASLRDRDGYIYFGGVNGFNRFQPENVRRDSLVPPVVITDFLLFNRSVPVEEDSPLENQISQTEVLSLDHNASVITFEYAALDYSARKGNHFAYKLEGFDEDWNYVEDLRRATYTNLSPGEYTFRVMAANRDGVWDETGASISLIITPPFWKTTWFLILMLLALAGIIYSIYRLRIYTIRKRNRLLATTIAERTHELKKANATKNKLFSIIAHDLINISTGLTGLSDLLKESIENENMDEIRDYSVYLHQTTSKFATMLKNMLDWARSQTGRIKYDPMNFYISEIAQEVLEQEESRAIYKKIKLVSTIDDELEVYADPDMVLVILRNLVANALKFTDEGGEIRINALKIDNQIEISVSDNGIGMNRETIKKIFNLNESITTRGTSDERGTGLGISICQDFIRKNKGEIRVDSKPNAGTTIFFTLPVSKQIVEQSNMVPQAS